MKLKVKSVRWAMLGLALVTGAVAAGGRDGQLARIVDEGRLGERGIAVDGELSAPGLPASLLASQDDVCLTVGYNIKSDGSTSNLMVLNSWSAAGGEAKLDPAYADEVMSAAASTVAGWKFKNADGDGRLQPMFTATTFNFSGAGKVDAGSLRSHCAISDLTAHIQSVKSSRFLPGSRDTFDIEQAQRYQAMRMTMINPGPGSRTGVR